MNRIEEARYYSICSVEEEVDAISYHIERCCDDSHHEFKYLNMSENVERVQGIFESIEKLYTSFIWTKHEEGDDIVLRAERRWKVEEQEEEDQEDE